MRGHGFSRVVRAAGRGRELLEGRGVPHGSSVTSWVLTNRKPLFNTDPMLDLPTQAADAFSDYRALAVAPVAHDRALYGAVSLYSASLDEYDARQQRLLCEAASLFARSLAPRADEPQAINEPTAKPPRFAVTTLESNLTH